MDPIPSTVHSGSPGAWENRKTYVPTPSVSIVDVSADVEARLLLPELVTVAATIGFLPRHSQMDLRS